MSFEPRRGPPPNAVIWSRWTFDQGFCKFYRTNNLGEKEWRNASFPPPSPSHDVPQYQPPFMDARDPREGYYTEVNRGQEQSGHHRQLYHQSEAPRGFESAGGDFEDAHNTSRPYIPTCEPPWSSAPIPSYVLPAAATSAHLANGGVQRGSDQIYHVPRGVGSQYTNNGPIPEDTSTGGYAIADSPGLTIGTQSNFVETLDKRYVIVKDGRRFFKLGRVFKVLWTEPAGASHSGSEPSSSMSEAKFGERFIHKIRRFVVVGEQTGHSICLPLHTYEGRGAMKPGLARDSHAAVYPQGGKVKLAPGENLSKKAFPIILEQPGEKLDPMTRINFTKLYTIEHNVKVAKIGRIPTEFLLQLRRYSKESIFGADAESGGQEDSEYPAPSPPFSQPSIYQNQHTSQQPQPEATMGYYQAPDNSRASYAAPVRQGSEGGPPRPDNYENRYPWDRRSSTPLPPQPSNFENPHRASPYRQPSYRQPTSSNQAQYQPAPVPAPDRSHHTPTPYQASYQAGPPQDPWYAAPTPFQAGPPPDPLVMGMSHLSVSDDPRYEQISSPPPEEALRPRRGRGDYDDETPLPPTEDVEMPRRRTHYDDETPLPPPEDVEMPRRRTHYGDEISLPPLGEVRRPHGRRRRDDYDDERYRDKARRGSRA